jgi:choline dehydrogenase
LDRPNLHILTCAQTMKLIIDEDSKTVTGVAIRRGKNKVELKKSSDEIVKLVKNTGEVIVSCGALATPQILQLSGIGPHEMLDAVGVKCIVDLPVGMNLQDHVGIPIFFCSKIPTITSSDYNGSNFQKWLTDGTGVYHLLPVQVVGFFNTYVCTE